MKIRILSIYNRAKVDNLPMLFSAGLSGIIPKMYDQEGNEIDTDFVAFYLQHYAIFDKYIKYNHGKKIYYYDSEEFDNALTAFKDEAAAIMSVHAPAWASEFAANVQKNKVILQNEINKMDTLGQVDEIRWMGAQHSETLYGEDETTATYGATETTMSTGTHKGKNEHSEKTFENNSMTVISKDEKTDDPAEDVSSSISHEDNSVREARTDETDSDAYVDRIEKPETVNEYLTVDNIGYLEKLKELPEFTNLMHKIINTIIIETGAKYDY